MAVAGLPTGEAAAADRLKESVVRRCINEDAATVLGQFAWLRALHETESEMTIPITRDETVFTTLIGNGLFGDSVEV